MEGFEDSTRSSVAIVLCAVVDLDSLYRRQLTGKRHKDI